MPYLTSHSKNKIDSSILWLNAAETWVEIATLDKNKDSRLVDFTSATGRLDCFIFGSSNSPKET